MRQCWQCDYCGSAIEDKIIAEQHENKCEWNPASRNCKTCKHSIDAGAPISGYHHECSIKINGHENIDDDGGSCLFWNR